MEKLDYIITVLVPIYNRAPSVVDFITRTVTVLSEQFTNFEVLLVDDGSTDETSQTVDELLKNIQCVRYLRLGRHAGKNAAISAGLNTAIGDYVVILSMDTDPVDIIPGIIATAMSSKTGVAYGVPKDALHEGNLISWGLSKLFHSYCQRVLQLNIPMGFRGLVALNRQAVNLMIRTKAKDSYSRISRLQGEVLQYERDESCRKNGRISFIQKLRNAIELIEANSSHPLRTVTQLGIIASVLNFVYACYVIGVYFINDEVAHGWLSTSGQISAMFFFLFLLLVILSEYLGQLFNELVDRETDPVVEERNSSVLLAEEDKGNVVSTMV